MRKCEHQGIDDFALSFLWLHRPIYTTIVFVGGGGTVTYIASNNEKLPIFSRIFWSSSGRRSPPELSRRRPLYFFITSRMTVVA